MTLSLTNDGLSIDTFDEALNSIAQSIGTALSLTPEQTEVVRQSVQSTLGQIARIHSEYYVAGQEALLAVYNALTVEASGTQLDRVARILGVTRKSALQSQVQGTATGTPATSLPNGTRLRYNPESTVWQITGGPYTIGGGGTVTITLIADSNEAYQVAIDPDTGFDDWTILDTVSGFTSFESTAQPIVGSPAETDAGLRTRMEVEAYRRGQGPLLAIEAAVGQVVGVTFVRAFENRTDSTDGDSIPARAINVVVEGGDNTQVAQAIFDSRPAGARIFALADGSEVNVTLTDSYGFAQDMAFNRVTDVDIHYRITLTTSTAETLPPPDLSTLVAELVVAQSALQFDIGEDIKPWNVEGIIYAANYSGLDSVLVEVSDDGASWSTTKYPISIRQRGVFDVARVTVSQV